MNDAKRKSIVLPALVFSLSLFGAIESELLPKRDGSPHKFQKVEHLGYTLGYCECWEQAAWVIEELTTNSFGDVERTDNFRADPLVLTGSATLADYKGSGYDRGHLACAEDFSGDATKMSESFYLSNISPQNASLNRGSWSKLEKWVRDRVTDDKTLFVVTGPIITNVVETIGENEVVVPNGYYKVLYDTTEPQKMIAFTYANAKGESADPALHVATVDEVEAITGLDFFPSVTNGLEAVVDYAAWTNTPQKVGMALFVSFND